MKSVQTLAFLVLFAFSFSVSVSANEVVYQSPRALKGQDANSALKTSIENSIGSVQGLSGVQVLSATFDSSEVLIEQQVLSFVDNSDFICLTKLVREKGRWSGEASESKCAEDNGLFESPFGLF